MGGIDDKRDARKKQDQFEALAGSPFTPHLLAIAVRAAVPVINSLLPPEYKISDAVAATLSGTVQHIHSVAKRKTEVFSNEFHGLLSQKDDEAKRGEFELTDRHVEYLHSQLMPLFIDGVRRSQQIRSEERIRRLARVVVNGFVETAPADESEEMMRIVADIGEFDTVLLKHLYAFRFKEQNDHLKGVTPKYFVSNGVAQDIDTVASSFLKLQSFGLVIANGGNFRILVKGRSFLRFAGIVPLEEE